MAASSAITFSIIYQNNIQANYFFDTKMWRKLVLHRPWYRLPSYLFGVFLALIVGRIHILKTRIHFSTTFKLFQGIIGLILCIFCVVILQVNNEGYLKLQPDGSRKGNFTSLESAIYTAFSPLVFLTGITALILPSITSLEYGDGQSLTMRMLFTYHGWRILYKLTITAYIVHQLLLFWYFSSVQAYGNMLSRLLVIRVAFGGICCSFLIGLVFYLLIDKPIRNIDRLVLFPTKISDSFLIKKTSKARSNRKQHVKFDPNGMGNEVLTDVNEESNGSDESEDEDTQTVRKAVKVRSSFMADESQKFNFQKALQLGSKI